MTVCSGKYYLFDYVCFTVLCLALAACLNKYKKIKYTKIDELYNAAKPNKIGGNSIARRIEKKKGRRLK